MTSAILVGDMHCVTEEIPECERLVGGIVEFAQKTGVKHVVFLGDQHHTMSTVRLEVQDFWRRSFAKLKAADLTVTALVGNHDLSNDFTCHAMAGYAIDKVVDSPFLSPVDGHLYLPYIHEKDEFVKICNSEPFKNAKVVICHASFDGAQYENGCYVGPEGINLAAIPQKRVISGHIHKPAEFDKLWYVGSPRWRSASDANEERSVWAVQWDGDTMVGRTRMDTAMYCRRIVHLQDTPEAPASPPEANALTDVRVDVRGPTDYVLQRAAQLEANGVRVKTFRTDAVRLSVKESDGIEVAWGKFVQAFKPTRGTAASRVLELAKEHYGIMSM